MRINNVASGRPTYYDRNPSEKLFASSRFAVAPAAITTRSTYTVPSNKKAFIESASANVIRRAVATTAIATENHVFVNPLVGGIIYLAYSVLTGNVVGNQATQALGSLGFMGAGDAISVEDGSSDTGGTSDQLGAGKIVEFDA